MSISIAAIKNFAVALFLSVGLATAAVGVQSVAMPTPAEAGKAKKAKKVLKWVSKGARKFEKKMAKKGKVGRFLAKGARGVRKGANKASKGVSKAQRKVAKAFNKVCKRNCRKVVRAGNRIRKGINRLKKEAERKCAQFGRNSKACRMAREAMEFASPI